MAAATTDVNISTTDGWVKVATAPAAFVAISSKDTGLPFFVAIVPTTTTPAATLQGLKVVHAGKPWRLQANIGGDVFVRVQDSPANSDPRHFSVASA